MKKTVLKKLVIALSLYLLTTNITAQNGIDDSWNRYLTYNEYIDTLHYFVDKYPEICRMKNLGTTENFRSIFALKLTANPDIDEAEPEVLLSATIHGNEPAGFLLLLRFADYLLKNKGKNEDVDKILNNTELWIVPLINPDGLYRDNNETVTNADRENANGVDLNRDFPALDNKDSIFAKETVVLMQFFDERDFTLSATYHTGTELINYPWDTWPKLHADDKWFKKVCLQYADTAKRYSPSTYFVSNDDFEDTGITNGFEWYYTSGSMQDYLNYYKHCRDVTIEVNRDQNTASGEAPYLWQYNYRSMLNYCLVVLESIRGTVSNEYGMPIAAKIEIPEHDNNNSYVYADTTNGYFCRPIYDGFYNLQITAEGYDTLYVDNVYSTDYLQLTMHEPITAISENRSLDIRLFPNPANEVVYIQTNILEIESVTIYNQLGGQVSINEHPPENIKTHKTDTSMLKNGCYVVKVVTKNNKIAYKKILICR